MKSFLRHLFALLLVTLVIEPHPDQKTLTEQFTEEAVKFVRAKRDQPFFLYLARLRRLPGQIHAGLVW